MSTLLIKNGRVIDPKNQRDGVADVFVTNGKITAIGENIKDSADRVIDASGLVVTPGLVDLQVHFREPGREDRETLETGSMAALAGGVTSAVAMPNLNPVSDNQTVIEFIKSRAKETALMNIYPTGSITKGEGGRMLAEINEMKRFGAVAITDDGFDVQDEGLLRRAMEYAKSCGILIMSHCETKDLTEGGVMHEGWVSTQLGLPGTPALSEDLAVYKNVLLAEDTGARLHLLHNSSKGAIRSIREAKARRASNITAEVSVQHFALTDEECLGYNTNAKMYPPLRSREHVDAVIEGIKDGTIDCLTTDHAPHTEPDKLAPFQDAAMGSIGLETSFAAMNTYLVQEGHIDLSRGIALMSHKPAEIIDIDKGHLTVGTSADIAIFDINKEWTVDAKESFSKGRNNVWHGKTLKGKAIYTIVDGIVRFENGKII